MIRKLAKRIKSKLVREVNFRRFNRQYGNFDHDSKEVFSDIYSNALWGGDKGEIYSGEGSHKAKFVEPYVDFLTKYIMDNSIGSICDVGAGDFYIMNQIVEKFPQLVYRGIDVVPAVVDRDQQLFGNERVSFTCLDASEANVDLPKADLIIVRQVLQHLSNSKIQSIVEKTKLYKHVVITEHLYTGEDVIYNIDLPSGRDVRCVSRSGVYIDRDPYCIENAEVVLDIPYGKNTTLRTWSVKNNV